MGNMADELLRDDKVSSSDCVFSSIKIGDYDCLNLNLEWKDDVVNMLPSDPFEMNISSGCKMIRGWIQDDDDINLDDTCGLFFFDESSKHVLHSINEHDDDDDEGGFGPPHDGLFYVLGYLEIRDLFSVERVCKSLRDGVRNDPLLWRNIEIDQPPEELFTDDSLLRITNRANGSLHTLSLDSCLNITDYGLKNVFQQNPGLTKLSVFGCNGLTIEGLLSNLKSFKSSVGNGIKRLRIGGLHRVTMEHYEELKKVLSIDNNQKPLGTLKPRFYHGSQFYLSLDDDRPIDLEACPKCHQLRQVYDCPEEKCTGWHIYCRACTFCIPRCISCGCCFDERDYMETFLLDFLCLDCLTHILRFPDGKQEDIGIPGFHQKASYHFCLYG